MFSFSESSAGVITTPAVRERFTAEETSEAYLDFTLDGPSLIDEETGDGVGVFEPSPGRILFVVEKYGLVEISTIEDFGLSKPYPPPARDRMGSAAAVVISTLVAVVTTLAVLIYLIG